MLVRGVGHMSLPIHRRTVHEIGLTLAQLDPHGGTVRAGVTSIASDRRRPQRPTGAAAAARQPAGQRLTGPRP